MATVEGWNGPITPRCRVCLPTQLYFSAERTRRTQSKREIGYHRRSLVETAFFRLKTLFGHGVTSRTLDGQHAELMIRCTVLNCMTQFGCRTATRL